MTDIDGADLLEALFGHWPDFYDAELRTVHLESRPGVGASLELEIEVAEMSSEIDERGFYRDRQRCRTVLRFDNVLNVRLDGFRHQNALDALEIAELEPSERVRGHGGWGERRNRVRLIPIPGFCEMDFLCDGITVRSATSVARAT